MSIVDNKAENRYRYFKAASPAAIATIRDFHAKRCAASNAHGGFFVATIERLMKHLGSKKKDVEFKFGYQTYTFNEREGFGRPAKFTIHGPVPRNCLEGWENGLRRSCNEVDFRPASDAVKAQIAALPEKPSVVAFFKQQGWRFFDASTIVASPQIFVIGDKMCGFAAPRTPAFPGGGAKLLKALESWQPPKGFSEISQARYDLVLAEYRLERAENAEKQQAAAEKNSASRRGRRAA